jgi:small ligand-binding sensory domain FIST
MRAALGHSSLPDTAQAVEQALDQVRSTLDGRADFALLFATSEHAEGVRHLAARAALALGRPALLGGSTTGVITTESENEQRCGLGILALQGVRAQALLASDVTQLRTLLKQRSAERLLLALPDPRRLDPALLSALLEPGDGVLAGAGISGEEQALFGLAGLDAGEGQCPAAMLEGLRYHVGVAQGAEPASEFVPITRSRRNAVLELGGQPAAQCFRRFLQAQGIERHEQLPPVLFVALRDPGASEHLIRAIVGVDPDSGAVVVQAAMESGMELAFAWRETLAAMRDRDRMLKTLRATPQTPVRAALYFNCMGRGRSLHLEDDADLRAIRSAFPGVPVIGMASSFELGPLAGKTRLLMYSGVLVLLADAPNS